VDKIYQKSPKAVKEFQDGIRTLSLRHRQLLLMVDGTRTSADLAKVFSTIDAEQMLSDLEKLGYLVDKNSTAMNKGSTDSHANAQDTDKDVLDTITSEHVAFIKTFMINELEIQMGPIMGRDLISKIQKVTDNLELKPCIARWHMAIRDSKNGRTVSDELMGKLHHIIANPPRVPSSKRAS
jgi:hypothetical protein